uniref:Uncharacterized protein n=1 Tax=Glossina austeni TaxID=7395 RepID=A0A1A9V0J9_GLOAU
MYCGTIYLNVDSELRMPPTTTTTTTTTTPTTTRTIHITIQNRKKKNIFKCKIKNNQQPKIKCTRPQMRRKKKDNQQTNLIPSFNTHMLTNIKTQHKLSDTISRMSSEN